MTSEIKFFEAQLQHHKQMIEMYANWIVEHQLQYNYLEHQLTKIKQRNEEENTNDN